MDGHVFEQVINLQDKPSVRRNRTPEMDQMYKQQTFNHLFSIEEDAPAGRKSCNWKTLAWVTAATVLVLVSMAVLLLMVVVPGSENDNSSEGAKEQINSNENNPDSKGTPAKGPTSKASDPISVTQKQPVVTSTASLHSTGALSPTGSELITTITGFADDASSTINQSEELTTSASTDVCPIQSTGTAGCLLSPLELCRSPGACQTFFPNRYGKGDTPNVVMDQYTFFNFMFANLTCHPQAADFTCSILSPSCPENPAQSVNESNYAFDVVNFPTSATRVPCTSLCNEIGDECLSNASTESLSGWTELCQSMPDSSLPEICFGGNQTSDSQCKSSPCYNGGTCFTKGSESYCKCPYGYVGKVCNKIRLSGANITRGDCVSVPKQCRSVLPYSTTRGLYLNDRSQAYIAPWDTISAVVRNDTIKRLFCALYYPQCNDNTNRIYTVCWDLCNIVKGEVEFLLATLGFPSLQCGKVMTDTEASRNGLTCLRIS